MEEFAGKFLTFLLGNEHYGIKINAVKEIIGIQNITPVPKSPDYLKGLINLRGQIIPIMDLRLRFSLEEKEYSEITCIIVVELTINDKLKGMGVVVDIVSEVIDIEEEAIDLLDKNDIENKNNFIVAIGKIKDKVIMLLDMEHILKDEKLDMAFSE